jgi:hypothetical protein
VGCKTEGKQKHPFDAEAVTCFELASPHKRTWLVIDGVYAADDDDKPQRKPAGGMWDPFFTPSPFFRREVFSSCREFYMPAKWAAFLVLVTCPSVP